MKRAAWCLLLIAQPVLSATFEIRSTDDPGEGLNDATPVVPVGGNNAATLGAARMAVLIEAGRIWGNVLNSSVPIKVDANFAPQTCATGTTLGTGGALFSYRNFAGAPLPDVIYASALADALSGVDRNELSPFSAGQSDIRVTLNSSVGADPTCASGRSFYLGFDHVYNRTTQLDLLLVVLHEIGHGLGITSNVSLTTGNGSIGGDGIERFNAYVHQVFDEQANQVWPQLTAAERLQSAVRTGSLAWHGGNVNAHVGRFTAGVTFNGRLRLYAPATISTGSSVSHFDPVIAPSILMEPNLATSITQSTVDITACALQDIGWSVTRCPDDGNVNRSPTATSQSVTVIEDTPLVIMLVANDPDNDPLTLSVGANPARGTLSGIASAPPRTVTYTPNANANGGDGFTFTASDGIATSNPATVTISITPVNDAPLATNSSVSVQTGQTVAAPLLGNDVDGDALTYLVTTSPASGALSGVAPNLSYRPNDGFTGGDSFAFRVSDPSGASANATVTITVSAPAPAAGGGGGGGSFSIVWFVLLAPLLARRKR